MNQYLLIALRLDHIAMFDLSIKKEDIEWLKKYYPALKIHYKDNKATEVIGDLYFSMVFLEEGKPYIINPDYGYSNGVKIKDKYQIRIELKGSEFSDLPQVYETNSRLKKVADSRNIKKEDLHINPSGAACLCIKPEEAASLPNGFNFQDFFNNLVIPFFYAQSYFEKNNTWPWGQYSHGIWGFIEWYLKQDNPTRKSTEDFLEQLQKYNNEWQLLKNLLTPKREVKGHQQCICGKDEKFRNCHKDILHGIWKLKQDIAKFSINMQ